MSVADRAPGMSDVSIGLADSHDIAAVTDAWWALVSEQSEHDDRMVHGATSKRRANHFIRRSVIDGRLLVARFDSMIVGIATFSEDHHFLDDTGRIWIIADVWVAPDMRRRGIANRLVKAAERACLELGAREIRLQVYASNEAAQLLYETMGYGHLMQTLRKRF